MKARFNARSIATLVAIMATSGVVSVAAQPARTPPRPDTPRLMVQVFGSADKKAGPEASDELRERLIRAFPSRILWVIDRKDVVMMLEQSGYDTTAQLQPSDESALAKQQRADEYIRGRVSKEGEMYKAEAWLVLTRDNSLMQPIPSFSANRPDRAAAGLVKGVQDARKQIANEKACRTAAQTQKYDEALKLADEAIAEYPNAVLVRYCKMNVLSAKKASDAELLAAAKEILAIDPNSRAALAVGADVEARMGNAKASSDYLIRLLAANPTDRELSVKVIEALASTGDFAAAKEYVSKAVAENPGDPALLSLQFKILVAAKDFKDAVKVGEEMVGIDTSLATAEYFTRIVAIFDADSQPQKAAEAAAKATQKFSGDADLWQMYAAALKKAGQGQQSIAAAKRALEINPKIPNGWTQIAIAFNDLQMPDSALVALRQAKAAGDDANTVGGIALNIGNGMRKAADALDAANKKAANYQMGLPYLHFADSTATDATVKTNAAFLIGVSSYYIAQLSAQNLAASKSCDEAKMAQGAATDAMIFTQRGGRVSPENAATILGAVNQLSPFIDSQVKTLCK